MSRFPTPGVAHVVGPATEPLLECTIGTALTQAARSWPDDHAVVVPQQGIAWTWSELDARATRVAANLLAVGLEPGDRIGVWSPNRAEWILLQLAAARAGLIFVTINPAYRPQELAHALRLVGLRALVISPSFKTSDYVAMLAEVVPEVAAAVDGSVHSATLPGFEWVFGLDAVGAPRLRDFGRLRDEPSPAALARLSEVTGKLSANDPVNIQFTSGTTGAPKGATLSHRNILNNGHNLGRALRLGSQDRLCLPVPLYHCFGMVMGVLACLTHGAAIVLSGERFQPRQTLEVIATERCTVLYGVPTMFVAELEELRASGLRISTLRAGVMAGALCPIELMRAARSELGIADLIIAYGMTETSPVSFQTAPTDAVELQVSTVGRVQPHLECKIIDAEGNTVAVGERGELCTRGYAVMRGYWNQPKESAAAIDAEGWMHSGDTATIDADGYCRITGRIKDMIIRGGENIYPAEIEAYLRQHERIRGVEVVGIPDETWGEIVCACVIAERAASVSADEIREYCRDRIAHYKVPELVVFLEAFPMTVTGKIQKSVLREIVAGLRGQGAGSKIDGGYTAQ